MPYNQPSSSSEQQHAKMDGCERREAERELEKQEELKKIKKKREKERVREIKSAEPII
jgi:hypothetical protein